MTESSTDPPQLPDLVDKESNSKSEGPYSSATPLDPQLSGLVDKVSIRESEEEESDSESEEEDVFSSTTHLCFCVNDYTAYSPMVFYISLLDMSNLFAKEHHDGPKSLFAEDLMSSTEHYPHLYGYGMVVASDGYLYIFSQQQNVCMSHIADLREYDTFDPQLFKSVFLGPRFTPKKYPIVVEIKQCIYVLSHHKRVGSGVVDLSAFGVYDPSTCVWQPLDSPPCMVIDLAPTDYLAPICAYFVYDKYLCVSTECMSFAFNTHTQKWEPCLLFTNRTDPSVDPDHGPPFEFCMKALIYEDYLLCSMDASTSDVLAYKIEDGKMLGKPIEIMSGEYKKRTYGYYNVLVDLRGGEFCLISFDSEVLYFTKFKVVKSDGSLTCAAEDIKVSKVDMPYDIYHRVFLYQALAF